jgi:hypothetical protein
MLMLMVSVGASKCSMVVGGALVVHLWLGFAAVAQLEVGVDAAQQWWV